MASSEIYNGHVQCLDAFASLLQALQHPSRDLSGQFAIGEIQEEVAKYKVWAANTGAINGSDCWALSLDCRLQEASTLRGQVTRLLQSLARSARQAAALLHDTRKPSEQVAHRQDVPGLEPGDESTDSDSPWEISDDDEIENSSGDITERLSSAQISRIPDPSTEALRLVDSPNEMTQLLGSIKYTVICLYRMPLRKPAPIDRIKGYDGTDMSLYQHFDVLYIRDKFPAADESLTTRLGKLITRRRQLLEYRRSHNEKLVAPRQLNTEPRQPQPPSWPTEPGPGGANVLPGAAEGTTGQHLGVGIGEGVTVRTRATVLRADQLPQGGNTPLSLYAPSIAESRVSAASSFTENQKLQIPPRPQGPDGQDLELFECPYCGTLQNIPNTATRAWEKHVLRDLQPYVCTFEPCGMSSHFFSTKDEWFNHELTVHRTLWSCNTCLVAAVDEAGGDQHLTFNNQADLSEHMAQVHHISTSRLAVGRAMEAFRRPVPVRDGQCSLCNGHANKLKNHLARHLEQIALFALPRPAPATESSLSHQVLAGPDGRGSGDTRGADSRESSLGTFHSGPGDNISSGSLSAFGEQPGPDNQSGGGDGSEGPVTGDNVRMGQPASPESPVTAGGSPDGAPLRPRDEYALEVQRVAESAVKKVTSFEASPGPNRVSSLGIVPALVYRMATLLRLSSEKAVTGFKVPSQEIMGDRGEVIRMLPHESLHTSIEYCIDLGRSTLIESEKVIDWIRDTANSYIMNNGSISLIIDLLQRPHDARDDLWAEANRIHESARLCLEKIKDLCDKFKIWYEVILRRNSAAVKAKWERQNMEDHIKLKRELAIHNINSLSNDEAIARQAVEEKESELQNMRKELVKASAAVNRVTEQKDLESGVGYEAWLASEVEVQGLESGLLEMTEKTASGETKEGYEARQTKMANLYPQRKRYMEKMKAEREGLAKTAKDQKSRLIAKVEQTNRDLSSKLHDYHIARAKQEEEKGCLARLEKEEMELSTAFGILDTSCDNLGILREDVSQLTSFFGYLGFTMFGRAERGISALLQSIKRGARFNAKGEIASIILHKATKKSVLDQAFHLQARCSAIRDVSGTYLKVFKKYIEPGNDRMGVARSVPAAQWELGDEESEAWSKGSVTEIEFLAAKAAADMGPNIQERVRYLQEYAIHVAFPE